MVRNIGIVMVMVTAMVMAIVDHSYGDCKDSILNNQSFLFQLHILIESQFRQTLHVSQGHCDQFFNSKTLTQIRLVMVMETAMGILVITTLITTVIVDGDGDGYLVIEFDGDGTPVSLNKFIVKVILLELKHFFTSIRLSQQTHHPEKTTTRLPRHHTLGRVSESVQ